MSIGLLREFSNDMEKIMWVNFFTNKTKMLPKKIETILARQYL